MVAAWMVLAAAAGLSAGCAKFDAALGQQQAVVTFTPGTSQNVMMKVRSACSSVPGATPLAVPHGSNATNGIYDVRFSIDQASDSDVAKLETCLSKFHSVKGINIEQEGGD
jgi:hypothetical protein